MAVKNTIGMQNNTARHLALSTPGRPPLTPEAGRVWSPIANHAAAIMIARLTKNSTVHRWCEVLGLLCWIKRGIFKLKQDVGRARPNRPLQPPKQSAKRKAVSLIAGLIRPSDCAFGAPRAQLLGPRPNRHARRSRLASQPEVARAGQLGSRVPGVLPCSPAPPRFLPPRASRATALPQPPRFQ